MGGGKGPLHLGAASLLSPCSPFSAFSLALEPPFDLSRLPSETTQRRLFLHSLPVRSRRHLLVFFSSSLFFLLTIAWLQPNNLSRSFLIRTGPAYPASTFLIHNIPHCPLPPTIRHHTSSWAPLTGPRTSNRRQSAVVGYLRFQHGHPTPNFALTVTFSRRWKQAGLCILERNGTSEHHIKDLRQIQPALVSGTLRAFGLQL